MEFEKSSGPLVCVFAHPDDEAFEPGGSIAKFARDGKEIYLICVTKGDSNGDQKLAAVRREELLESARILGVKGVEFLGFGDGTLCNNLYLEIAGKIEEVLRKYQPDTVMTFEHRGISGHLDHIAVSMITTFVCKKLNFVKEILFFCEPKERIAAIKSYFVYMPPGYEDKQMDLVIDVGEFWETKVRAMKAHQSQKHDCDWLLEHFGKFSRTEHFLVFKK
jgi:LmbE family N-acetylglucosaminyl deacetylase